MKTLTNVHPGAKRAVLAGSAILALLGALLPAAYGQKAAQKTGVPSFDRPLKWSSSVGPDVPKFWVRPGFKVTLVADNIQNARFMQFDDHGNLFVSRPDKGDILRLVKKGDKYEVADTFVKGYRTVHGLDYKDGWLWFTRSGSVHKAKVGADGKAGPVEDVLTGLPSGGHWWRSIFVVADGFFTSIGDSGNINDLRDSDREKIWKYSLDGKTRTMYSSGIRNTEKLRYRPGSTDLYGCDHGSDWFGQPAGDRENAPQPITNAYPPCEFNLYVPGGFYGHPFLVGENVPRLETFTNPDIQALAATAIPPIWSLGPHWAPNGWTFTTKNMLGRDSAGDAVVANHGSWNRTAKSGYRIEQILFDKATDKPYGSLMLVSTLGEDDRTLGRPVDVVEESDGNLLFSDDQGNRIYRISREK